MPASETLCPICGRQIFDRGGIVFRGRRVEVRRDALLDSGRGQLRLVGAEEGALEELSSGPERRVAGLRVDLWRAVRIRFVLPGDQIADIHLLERPKRQARPVDEHLLRNGLRLAEE